MYQLIVNDSQPSLMRILLNPSQAAFAVLLITACSYKPFQPPPAMFKVWSKSNTTPQEIIRSMKSCSLNEVTGYHQDDTVQSTYLGEKCMEKLGYELKGSYRGICASENAKKTSECKNVLEE